MYTPNKHLDAAHQRLCNATSDEVNANTPSQHSNAPAQSYDVRQHVPQDLSQLHLAQHPLSPPHEAYRLLTKPLNLDNGCAYDPWQTGRKLLESKFQVPQHHPTAPSLHNNSSQPLQHYNTHFDWILPGFGYSYFDQQGPTKSRFVPNGLPLSPKDFLTQTRACHAFNGDTIKADRTSFWNTDGSEATSEATSEYPSSGHADYFPQPRLSEHRAPYGVPHVQPSFHQLAPPQTVQPLRASSIASTPSMSSNFTQLPTVQEWPTDRLTKITKTSRKLLDANIRRKQEKYRQKGDARRNTIATTGMNRKQSLAHPQNTMSPKSASHAPAKRRKITATSICRSSQLGPAAAAYQSSNADRGHTGVSAYLQSRSSVDHSETIDVPRLMAEELPQAIVSRYEDYKWSVYHYQLQPKGYDFAERWLQELLDTTLSAEFTKRHFSHVTQGFIKDGDRYSILVLHNATNPFVFEPTPSSTITIGVYGSHWYQHNEIRWTTLATDQRQLFDHCVQGGWLVEKCQWGKDAKPTEKRFHRAYWLAANRQDMRGLLNRGPSDDKPHDLVEEKGEEDLDVDFCISEADLTNRWDITDAEAAAAWQNMQHEVEALGTEFQACGPGWQHVVIASTEW